MKDDLETKDTGAKVTEAVEDTASKALEEVEKEEKLSKPKKEGKGKLTAIIIAGAVLVLGVICFFGYKILFKGNPATITSDAIRNLKSVKSDVKKESDGMVELLEGDKPYEITTNFKLELPEGMGTYSASAKIQADAKKEIASVDLKAKQGKSDLFSLDAIFNSNKLYFRLPDTMKEFYYTDITDIMAEFKDEMKKASENESLELYSTISKYDTNKLIDYVADSIDENLSKKDFEKSKEEITVKGKEVKATKYTTKIDEEKALAILKSFVKKAEKDKDLIKIIATLSDMSEEEVKEGFAEIKNTKIEEKSEGYILYSVYVSTLGDTLGFGFEVENAFNVIITNKSDVVTFDITVGMYHGTLTIEEESDDHTIISADVMGMITGKLDIKSNLDTIKKNKEYKETVDVKFSLSAMGQSIKAAFSAESVVKLIDSVDVSETKDAKDVDKLSTAEQYNLQKQVEKSGFYKFIEELSKSFESSEPVENYSF